MAGYASRQSTYTTGDTINASDSNNEFDAIVTAFGTSGHTHDGTAGNGGGLSKLAGSNSITIGAGTAGTDITVTFDGENNDGVLTWLEDEDMFKYSDDVMIADDEKLIFGTGSEWTIEYDEDGDNDLVLTGSDMAIESATSAKPVLTLFNSNADANSDAQEKAVKSFFAPEFRNRLDAVVQFKKLDKKLMYSVTEKFLKELDTMLEPRNVVLEYDQSVIEWLTSKGFTETMGARPMARVINEKIKKPLAKQILFGKEVDLVKLSIIEDDINIRTDKV